MRQMEMTQSAFFVNMSLQRWQAKLKTMLQR